VAAPLHARVGGETPEMPPSATAHPHALQGTAFSPAGQFLPAVGGVEARRHDTSMRAWLDVAGGVALALFVGVLCMKVPATWFGSDGMGWVPAIAWESVWLVAAILLSVVMPSGIRHDISVKSTIEGLKLDWPELMYATWVLGLYAAYIGELRLDMAPLGLALAVGTAEEFIFRVLLLGWLVSKVPAPTALAISSVVFGLAHIDEISLAGVLACAPQTAGGFVLGAVYLRTRNPIAPILAHAFWDYPYFMGMAAGVSGGGGVGGMPMPTVGELVPWIAFTVYGLWLVRHGVPLVGRVEPVGCTCEGPSCAVHQPAG